MVNNSFGWKVLKKPFLLLAFLISLKRFDTTREYLKDKRKSSYDFMFRKAQPHYYKCINWDEWDLYHVSKKALYFKDIKYRL